ncbi:MAG TPA: peptidoglycan-binding domain-containing protein [Pseudonocardiaceae bacterium]|jgi:peptidoglycan hydrolase-like protein with peptidoglycan-binding domain|nr:peptidoglycan-binding domain-containing protein [Pseudonocardiaceae bacterium]
MTFDTTMTQKLGRVTCFGARLALLVVLGLGLGSVGGAAANPVLPASPAVAASPADMPTAECGVLRQHPQIQRGDRGPAVAHAQCLLRDHYGQNIAVDGIFGPKTEQAVKRVQHFCGLQVDGIVGPHTWRVLHRPGTC